MAKYNVTFTSHAKKQINSLRAKLVEKIIEKIEALSDNPRPPGCLKLHHIMSLWRIRVGKYRIIYQIDDKDKIVDIISADLRKDVYRKL